ncbi:DNA internalization-related competence protein ComEC/Rec2 [uncultured Leptolyngbya sp.]|uniref:DNA internalization-related competence protein ComEC/Rec2 n=2 Tax=Cyanophyceae TaxID=3028117 RepID=A0A6J4PC59_9CYAN|nr:DNA internalization-related competence protein ComEC/Rec2 [uncultured Leptolyngbya sp.]CAA9560429.1 DNA internalization-related competence protein ComEC/Rec2 [uncultured Synechococcales cyanobacterium]
MSPVSGIVLGLAYILGLLSTAFPWGGYGVFLLGVVAAIAVPQHWRTGPHWKLWAVAGVVGLLAALYLQAQVPYPSATDISKFIADSGSTSQQAVTIQGQIESPPRLTRAQRQQFWLRVSDFDSADSTTQAEKTKQSVTGKLYVTVPPQAKPIHPGQVVAITGTLYKPRPATNPQGFDFQAYLKREGTFAGFNGRRLTLLQEGAPWGWWRVRQRIIQAQVRWLGVPAGPLVSAMVLGSRAVDLPFEVRDEFMKVGLAHALAASGFQTSLILAVVLALTRQQGTRQQLGFGTAALITFGCLSGFEPAVLRAVFMGFAGLIALATKRQARPLAILLGVAVLMLFHNPIWIWNLGFQLSFLATLGLIVTVPALSLRLDWLPPAIAALIAVPMAALVWTLPLQLFSFGTVPIYSLLANVVATPLISVITIGGFISGLAGLIWPLVGSALAWLLYYPAHSLIGVVHWFSRLPGSSVALGTIDLWQLVLLYGALGLAWRSSWWQRRWWLAGLAALAVVAIPVWQTKSTIFQVTVLATQKSPIMVIQERGWTTLINSGDELTARSLILPFLEQQGINQIDWAIATDPHSKSNRGWLELLQRLPVKQFSEIPIDMDTGISAMPREVLDSIQEHSIPRLPLQPDRAITGGATEVEFIRTNPVTLRLHIDSLDWLLLSDVKTSGQETWVTTTKRLFQPQVLWWSGKDLPVSLVSALSPQVVVASSTFIDPDTVSQLQANNIQLYWTNRDGAIQWTRQHRFEKHFDQANPVDSKLS